MEQRRDLAIQLVQAILEAESEHEDRLHRDKFLAAAIAADNVGLSPTKVHEISEHLQPLTDSPIPTIREKAWQGLVKLAQLGHKATLTWLASALKDARRTMTAMSTLGESTHQEACRSLKDIILIKLDDRDEDVRGAAIEALAPLLPDQPDLLPAIIAKLDDQDDEYGSVRRAAIEALIPHLPEQQILSALLLPWLGCTFEYNRLSGEIIRRQLAIAFAPLLRKDEALQEQITTLLDSPAWPARKGAAWALIGMPGGPPASLIPRLKRLLDDFRAEESWPYRLQVAEILLNHQDPELDRRAIAVAVEALDYATQPWYGLPRSGAAVRRQATLILGQLDPVYFDQALFNCLRQVMEEDANDEVRDAAYQALLRMATAPKRRE